MCLRCIQSGGSHGTAAACFEVFRFSEGRLYDQETFLMGEIGDAKRARTEFLERYYSVRDRVLASRHTGRRSGRFRIIAGMVI
ncbi:MAG: hypothetical protein ACLTE2_11245 [Eubacteriales bacterium]